MKRSTLIEAAWPVRSSYCRKWKMLSAILLLACLTASCVKHDDALQRDHTIEAITTRIANPSLSDFFSCDDEKLDTLLYHLYKREVEKPFALSFIKNFGIPLWNYSYYLETEEDACLFVPLLQIGNSRSIDSMWFFHITDTQIDFCRFTRSDDCFNHSDQAFVFDLLSYRVFGTQNATGYTFVEKPQTRGAVVITRCWDVYTGTEGNLTYSYTNCVDDIIWISDARDTIDDRGEGGGSNGGIYIGGGTPDFSGPPSSIQFDYNSKDPAQIQRVNEMIDSIMVDCMGGELIRRLGDMIGDSSICIDFDSENGASYNPTSDVITLGEKVLTANVLLHELFHAYQNHKNPELLKGYKLNSEIETRYAQYIFLKENNPGKDLKEVSSFSYDKTYDAICLIGNYLTNSGELRNPDFHSLFEVMFEEQIAPTFKIDEYAGYSYTRYSEILDNFKQFQELTKNC